MKEKKTYAVFGLGRYGTAVARELVDNGMDVVAVDINQKIVNNASAFLPVCKCADVSDAEVISRLGIKNVDVVVVCMAENLESSIMAVNLCKEAGVPTVIAKCANETHKNILLRVGADRVVIPETEAGTRLAKDLLSYGFIDVLSLSKNASLVEIPVKNEWVGKDLIELNLRRKYDINVVAIKSGEKVITNINPEQPLEADSLMIVIANTAKLERLK